MTWVEKFNDNGFNLNSLEDSLRWTENNRMRSFLGASLFAFFLILSACKSGTESDSASTGSVSGTPTPASSPSFRNVTVTWAESKAKAVNAVGGGYRVYHGSKSGFSLLGASYVDVPYVSGAAAPTTAVISSLPTGRHYIKVVAYSVLNPVGANSGSTSLPSTEISVVIP